MAHVGEILSDHDIEIGTNEKISNCCNIEMGVGEET